MKSIFAARALAVDLKVIQTNRSSPEQYDVFYNDKPVGYMQLKQGCFTVECPGPGGELVFMSATRGSDVGSFETVEERKMNLKWAKLAISEWIMEKKRLRDRRCWDD